MEKKMILIPGGEYEIGTNDNIGSFYDLEGPITKIKLDSFYIDETSVTNEEFMEFVKETDYVTEAEKFGWSYVFHIFLTDEIKEKSTSLDGLNWWYAVAGANWKHPEGKGSNILDRLDHPVVHVSRNDALAYCKWANKRLPTEAEWEVAAKGGTDKTKFYWGEELLEDGKHHCNVWQGEFPVSNSKEDGYIGTAPVKTYDTNGYGLYQMIGNVWEWCLNPARVPLEYFNKHTSKEILKENIKEDDERYAIKGGSFLCHHTYCKRYRIAARTGNTGQSTTNHMGFRCVKDLGV